MGNTEDRRAGGRGSFTLVELLVALAILSAAMAIAWGALSVSLTAWKRGDDLLAGLRRGEAVADELAAALRSAFFRSATDGRYGFHLEKKSGDLPADVIRWVSLAGGAGPDGAGPGVPRRLTFGIEEAADDGPSAALRAQLAYLDPDEETPDPVVRAWPEIRGFECRVWNPTNETWEAEWTNTNALPAAVEIALYAATPDDGRPPVALRRRVDLPVTAAVPAMGRETGGRPPAATPVPVRGGAARPPSANPREPE